MSLQQQRTLATAAVVPPSLLAQVGMAGSAAVITVSFIHPIDVIKVRRIICFDESHLSKPSSSLWLSSFFPAFL
jgi:hypothetical protein